MPSKQKRKIAQRNGAKAAGTKSPQGIQKSSMNALRHGLTSRTLVLSNESQAKFDQLLQSYIEKFRPRDGVEMNLVDEMVAARWRQQRVWMIQTAALDLQMDSQEEEIENTLLKLTEPTRIAMAFTAMANHEKALELLMRYETSYSRMHDRAMKALDRLRAEQNLRNDPTPVDPAPVDPAPVDPAPVDSAPIDRAPVEPCFGTVTVRKRNDAHHTHEPITKTAQIISITGQPKLKNVTAPLRKRNEIPTNL
jgi:hypothetical protein